MLLVREGSEFEFQLWAVLFGFCFTCCGFPHREKHVIRLNSTPALKHDIVRKDLDLCAAC